MFTHTHVRNDKKKGDSFEFFSQILNFFSGAWFKRQMSYSKTINETPPLAQLPNFPRAPGVVQGAPRLSSNLVDALDETEGRKKLRKAYPELVTNEELNQSMIRQAALVEEFGGTGVAPAWATQLVQNVAQLVAGQDAFNGRLDAFNGRLDALDGRLDAFNGRLDEVNGRLDAFNGRLDEVNGRLDALDAKFSNDRARFRHRKLRSSGVADFALYPLRKEVAGVGPSLPGHLVPDPGNGNVGEMIPINFFPPNLSHVYELTHDQLSTLSRWLNEDFGIIEGDLIATRRHKFVKYLVGE